MFTNLYFRVNWPFVIYFTVLKFNKLKFAAAIFGLRIEQLR